MGGCARCSFSSFVASVISSSLLFLLPALASSFDFNRALQRPRTQSPDELGVWILLRLNPIPFYRRLRERERKGLDEHESASGREWIVKSKEGPVPVCRKGYLFILESLSLFFFSYTSSSSSCSLLSTPLRLLIASHSISNLSSHCSCHISQPNRTIEHSTTTTTTTTAIALLTFHPLARQAFLPSLVPLCPSFPCKPNPQTTPSLHIHTHIHTYTQPQLLKKPCWEKNDQCRCS